MGANSYTCRSYRGKTGKGTSCPPSPPSFPPILNTVKDTESVIKSKLIELLTQLKRFTFMTTLALVLKKMESKDKKKYDNFYLSSKAEIIINVRDIDDVFQSIYALVITNIQKYLGKGSGWIELLVFQSVIL